MTKFEAVVTVDGPGPGCKAKLVENGIHEVAGAVAGEGAAGAIGSVGSGGEAEDEDAGAGISEAGNWAGPVCLVLVGATFGFADAAAIVAEAGATFTDDNSFVNLLEELRRTLCAGDGHCIP
jgi:hypothetical protein